MRILVTGANGYLGKGIVSKLLDDGYQVVAVDLRDNNIDDRAEKYCCDFFSIETPWEYFGKPDVLLHLAWRDGFVHNSSAHIEDIPKHFSFIRKMINSGVSQVSVMGTMHEIGFFEGAIDENTPCKPQSLYGIGKNALRQLVDLECRNKGTVFQWLRGFYIVGNTTDGASIFSKIMRAAMAGEQSFPFTTGRNLYDFLDFEVFCSYVAHAVEQKSVTGIINICSGEPVRLSERVEQFIREENLGIKLAYGVFPSRPYDSKAIWGDSTKIDAIEVDRERDGKKK
jgi:dTDP-6-deoxy-L-talose 4-dehydrogenase (NAD+)